MPNLSVLTNGQLTAAEEACQYLLELHRTGKALDSELAVKLDTLLADLSATKEDRQQADRRSHVAAAAARQAVRRAE